MIIVSEQKTETTTMLDNLARKMVLPFRTIKSSSTLEEMAKLSIWREKRLKYIAHIHIHRHPTTVDCF